MYQSNRPSMMLESLQSLSNLNVGRFHTLALDDAALAAQALQDEQSMRFSSFSANDAVTLGLSIRKRFRMSSRAQRGKGMLISIQTVAGQTLFACTVDDFGAGDVGMESWSALEAMVALVRKTGHCSWYLEKGNAALGKSSSPTTQGDAGAQGGAFPIFLENAVCCPIAIVACYSGSSADDHRMVMTVLRDYIKKMARDVPIPPPGSHLQPQETGTEHKYREHSEWAIDTAASAL